MTDGNDEQDKGNNGEGIDEEDWSNQSWNGYDEDSILEMSSDNPFVKSILNGVKYEQWHPRNDNCITHNIILVTDNKWC